MTHSRSQGPAEAVTEITDFELVRNGDGEWLLVVPELPDSICDNPLSEITAFLDGQALVLQSPAIQLRFSGFSSPEFATALRRDRPCEILLCTVDAMGIRTYARTVTFQS